MDTGDLAIDQARITLLRSHLGAQLATYRAAAGLSQPELGRAIGRTRSTISKIEHGTRGMPATLWEIADDLCHAQGVLISEHSQLAQAERDYRAWCDLHNRQLRQQQATAHTQALTASLMVPASPVLLSPAAPHLNHLEGGEKRSDTRLFHGQLAEELLAMITDLVRSVGRRKAVQMISWALAAAGLSGLDVDECTRVMRAVQTPARVDAHVVEHLAATLTHCKRLEDALGPCEILDTVLAQHAIVGRLLMGECPDKFVKPLRLLESTTASTIGICWINMGQPDQAKSYFERARKSGHEAGHPACAAYAAANASFAAFLRKDAPAALDMAAAARSLAARTNDPRLKALAEQMAAAAYALDGQYNPCMAASGRAHDLLTHANGSTPDSLAYWVHHGTVDSQRSLFLCLLGQPRQAVQAASAARDQFNHYRTFPSSYTRCHIRLGHALILDKEITEAARILGQAATQANLAPRLVAELSTARTLMQPWQHTPAVKTLDAQLHACGLISSQKS